MAHRWYGRSPERIEEEKDAKKSKIAKIEARRK